MHSANASQASPPSESVFAYIEEMLLELSVLAGRFGEPDLCASIEASALLSGAIEIRKQAMPTNWRRRSRPRIAS